LTLSVQQLKMAEFSKIKKCVRASMYQEALVVAPFCPLRRKHHQIYGSYSEHNAARKLTMQELWL